MRVVDVTAEPPEPIGVRERPDEEIDIGRMIHILWRARMWILFATLACGAVAFLIGWATPKQYQATLVLSPASDAGNRLGGAAGSLLSQVGDVGSLLGVSVNGDTKKAESVAVLQSESLTERYITANSLLPILYFNKWDSERHAWKSGIGGNRPTVWEANVYFKTKIRSVTTDSKTGLVTMRIQWRDPKLAAQWANGLVAMTNDYLRDKAIGESERNIAYLEDQAAKTNVVEVRAAIYSTLEQQIKNVMSARGNLEYALRVVDPAIAPEEPSSLGRKIWAAIGLALGFFLASSIAITRSGAADLYVRGS